MLNSKHSTVITLKHVHILKLSKEVMCYTYTVLGHSRGRLSLSMNMLYWCAVSSFEAIAPPISCMPPPCMEASSSLCGARLIPVHRGLHVAPSPMHHLMSPLATYILTNHATYSLELPYAPSLSPRSRVHPTHHPLVLSGSLHNIPLCSLCLTMQNPLMYVHDILKPHANTKGLPTTPGGLWWHPSDAKVVVHPWPASYLLLHPYSISNALLQSPINSSHLLANPSSHDIAHASTTFPLCPYAL